MQYFSKNKVYSKKNAQKHEPKARPNRISKILRVRKTKQDYGERTNKTKTYCGGKNQT